MLIIFQWVSESYNDKIIYEITVIIYVKQSYTVLIA